MKLKEALNKYSNDTVKLGSGSSFVYCGRVTENLITLLNEMSVKEFERLKKSYTSTVNHDKIFYTFWENKLVNMINKFNEEAYKNKWTEGVRERKYKKLIDKYDKAKAGDRRRTDENLKTLPERIENFTNYPEREVKEEYRGIEGDMIVIFEGLEVGSYWTVEEYERANKEGG